MLILIPLKSYRKKGVIKGILLLLYYREGGVLHLKNRQGRVPAILCHLYPVYLKALLNPAFTASSIVQA